MQNDRDSARHRRSFGRRFHLHGVLLAPDELDVLRRGTLVTTSTNRWLDGQNIALLSTVAVLVTSALWIGLR
jgi:hypothetical protein